MSLMESAAFLQQLRRHPLCGRELLAAPAAWKRVEISPLPLPIVCFLCPKPVSWSSVILNLAERSVSLTWHLTARAE